MLHYQIHQRTGWALLNLKWDETGHRAMLPFHEEAFGTDEPFDHIHAPCVCGSTEQTQMRLLVFKLEDHFEIMSIVICFYFECIS